VYNRAKPDRRGGATLHPLEIPEYPLEVIEFDCIIDLHKSGIHDYTAIFFYGLSPYLNGSL
jgi:hypothetical protein